MSTQENAIERMIDSIVTARKTAIERAGQLDDVCKQTNDSVLVVALSGMYLAVTAAAASRSDLSRSEDFLEFLFEYVKNEVFEVQREILAKGREDAVR